MISSNLNFTPLDFLRPYWLIGFFGIVLFSIFRFAIKQRQNKTGHSKAIHQHLIAPHLSSGIVSKPDKKMVSRFVSFNLLGAIACLALSGPTIRSVNLPLHEMKKAQVIAFDLSYSMYSTDLKPNRLSQARYKAIDLIKQWGEGEKALIAYAGDAFTITPLTHDGNAILNHIPNLSPDIMPVRGSRADLALTRSIELLKNAGYTQGHIVFISDGISDDILDKLTEQLKGSKWIVSVLAVGTKQGAPITLSDGTLLKSNQEIIIPKLKEKNLYQLSKAGHGFYLKNGSASEVSELAAFYDAKEFQKASDDKNADSTKKLNQHFPKDDGYWFAFLLLPLVLLLFRKGLFFTLLMSLFISSGFVSPSVEASIWKNDQQNGLQAYQDKDYQSASELFDDSLDKGSAFYSNKQYKEALEQFELASKAQSNNATAFYNKGNSLAQLQKYDDAISAYDKALAIDPTMSNAAENKKLIEKLKKQQEKQEQKKKDQQQKQDDKNQKKDEQQKQDKKEDQQKESDKKKQDQQSKDKKSDESKQNKEQKNKQGKKESEKKESEKKEKEDKQSKQEKSKKDQQKQQAQQKKKDQQKQQAQQKKKEQQKQQAKLAKQMKENKELDELPTWLKNMPDDPSILLQRKMQFEYQKRLQSNDPQNNNGAIW